MIYRFYLSFCNELLAIYDIVDTPHIFFIFYYYCCLIKKKLYAN